MHPGTIVESMTGAVPGPPTLDRAIAVPTAAVAGIPATVNDYDVALVKVNLAVPVWIP